MPVPAKSYLPALAAFIAFSFTYTAVVARKEGNAMDAARTRWQQQKFHAEQALSNYGSSHMHQRH